MTTFLRGLKEEANYTKTENNALTHKSTLNPVLDFFALAGAMRDNLDEALTLFDKAIAHGEKKALQVLFYLRDVRGGQGERDIFRSCLERYAQTDKEKAIKFLKYCVEFGRGDDIFALWEIDKQGVTDFVATQLAEDEKNMKNEKGVSLLAKWLPSNNTSSKLSRKTAKDLAHLLKISDKEYRKRVVTLRKYIEIVEQKMSKREWGKIDYSKTPSRALFIYRKAFERNDEKRYTEFIDKVEKGEAKINTKALYPHELTVKAKNDYDKTIEQLWKNLPDYADGRSAIVVADTSGSMTCGSYESSVQPIDISVGLAIYFAERNKGAFKNHFITFSERPELFEVPDTDLQKKVRACESAEWGYNTNIEAVFDLILETATKHEQKQVDMPQTVYIISDMEFDEATEGTNYQNAKSKFEEAGFKLPDLVFWNVSARHTQVPVTEHESGAVLVSGYSPTTFASVVEGKNAEEFMEEIIKKYEVIHS